MTIDHKPAMPHGPLREVLPGIFLVTGAMALGGPVRFSRNMVVVREGERLVLINSVRLSADGERELERLGKVSDVIRLAAFHGADDAWFKERFGATIWAIEGQRYVRGFDQGAAPYFTPDRTIATTPASELPLAGAAITVIDSRPPEAVLLLERDGGVLVTGDSLQNWGKTDEFFSLAAKLMMPFMGFVKPFNVGPGWLKQGKPSAASLRGLGALAFEHVLPAHGAPVIGGAKGSYARAIERAASKAER